MRSEMDVVNANSGKYPDMYMKEDSDLQRKYNVKRELPYVKSRKPDRSLYRSVYLRRMAMVNPEFKKKGLPNGYQVHHVKYVRNYPELVNNFDNLVLMHPDDHKLVHESDDSKEVARVLNKALKFKAAGVRPSDLY